MTFRLKCWIGSLILGLFGTALYDHAHQSPGIFLLCMAANLMFMEDHK
jgi:hypothetical protein